MSIIKNTSFVVDGINWTLNADSIQMESDLLFLCTREDGTGNIAKLFKFIEGTNDNSSLVALDGMEFDWNNGAYNEDPYTPVDYFYKGNLLLKSSETISYVVTTQSLTTPPSITFSIHVNIYKITKSGSTYTITSHDVRPTGQSWSADAIPDESRTSDMFPDIGVNKGFAIKDDIIFYCGYPWGISNDIHDTHIYAYNVTTGTVYSHNTSADFYTVQPLNNTIAIFDGNIWIANKEGSICVYSYSSGTFTFRQNFNQNDTACLGTYNNTVIMNFADDIFGNGNELFFHRGYDTENPHTPLVWKFNITTPGVLYNRNYFYITTQILNLNGKSIFGVPSENRNKNIVKINSTSCLSICANHGNLSKYKVNILKIDYNSISGEYFVNEVFNITDPNMVPQLFTYDSKDYILYGNGKVTNTLTTWDTESHGINTALYRLDFEAPPKIVAYSEEQSSTISIGKEITISADVYLDNSVDQKITGLQLQSLANEVIYEFNQDITSTPTTISHTFVIDPILTSTSFIIKGIVSGGSQNGLEIISNTISFNIVDYLNLNLIFQDIELLEFDTPEYKVSISDYLHLNIVFMDGEVSTFKDIELNFSVDYRTGYSPFNVKLTPTIRFNSEAYIGYQLDSINLYTDYFTDPVNYITVNYGKTLNDVTNTLSPITSSYAGYKGQTKDIAIYAILSKYSTTVTTDTIVKKNLIICGFNPKEVMPSECQTDYITKV